MTLANTVETNQAAAAAASGHPTLRKGAHGPAVHELQTALAAAGFSPGKIDSDFGTNTEKAVRAFQKARGLAADGVVGVNTWAALSHAKPTPTTHGTAAAMADLAHALVTTGLDGKPPGYKFGAEVTLGDKSPDLLDCSELVQWAVGRVTGKMWVDGSANQYSACRHIGVEQAIKTKGALLFIRGNEGVHHVAISMGNGKTAEARGKSSSPECGSFPATTGRFNLAGTIPVLKY